MFLYYTIKVILNHLNFILNLTPPDEHSSTLKVHNGIIEENFWKFRENKTGQSL